MDAEERLREPATRGMANCEGVGRYFFDLSTIAGEKRSFFPIASYR